jgi:arabinofuranan 3-O-arabinosyltransferase
MAIAVLEKKPVFLARPIELACIALVIAQTVYLAASYWHGTWILAPDGKGVPSDFVNVWAAGDLVLQHKPWLAYDWHAHKAVEDQAVGHSFAGYFGWHYPPMFLAIAAALALLPYAPAYFVWLVLTFPAYIGVVRAIIANRSGYLLAAAFPALLANAVVGQNGFLTAALFGSALVILVERPILAGVLIGLLTYKPHLGLLIPFALIAGGHWRAFTSASVTALVIAALSLAAFGAQTWLAFFGSISQTSEAFLSNGWADFGKLQTIFGLARMLGVPEHAAWILQSALAIDALFAVIMIWRSKAAFELKAAALVAGAMLATPYLYTYDLVVMAIPLAFMIRLGQRSRFFPYEASGMGIACALIASFPFVGVPVGFFALLIVATLILRRALISK